MTWRTSAELLERIRQQAQQDGRSLDEWVTMVLDAASKPSSVGTEGEQVRERLRRAGLLDEPADRRTSRPGRARLADARAGRDGEAAESALLHADPARAGVGQGRPARQPSRRNLSGTDEFSSAFGSYCPTKEDAMAGVRVLVGTRKGAFVLISDERRRDWEVSGPHFGGWEMYHLKGSPADPDRIYASQSTGWFGQLVQRSDDGGRTWSPVNNDFRYDGEPGTHQWYDGTPHPWEFARVWHLEPSLTDPDTVYAGVEDAALFRTTDGGRSWQELPGLREHGTGPQWQPGAGGLCLHTILLHPTDEQRLYAAISAAGAFRSDDGGMSWQAVNKGLLSGEIPQQEAEVGHCVHNLAMHPDRPDVLFMQKHWDVMRSDDAGGSWHEISGDLPSDFGFPIEVHAHEPDTVYVVPITSDSQHYPPDGRLRVYRSRSGGGDSR